MSKGLRLLRWVALAGTLVVALVVHAQAPDSTAERTPPGATPVTPGIPQPAASAPTPATTKSAQKDGPTEVHVGVFLKNIEDIDVKTNTYYMDFLLWFRWHGGHIDPTKHFRFVNLLDAWGVTVSPAFDAPITLPDGSKYIRYSVEGKFYSKFHLDHFPLDTHTVRLAIEDVSQVDELVYVPDTAESRLTPELELPGWRIEDFEIRERHVRYDTHFGQLGLAVPRTFSRLEFGVRVRRPHSFWYAKMLPPVVLVLLCSFLVFFLSPEHVDARISTVVTALLTAVFLQLTFTANLPEIGVLFHLDKVFNYSYLLMFLMLVECIVVTGLHGKASSLAGEAGASGAADERLAKQAASDALATTIKKIDRIALIGFPSVYVVGCVLITYFL